MCIIMTFSSFVHFHIILYTYGIGIAQPAWWEDVIGGSFDKNKEITSISSTSTHSPTPPPQRRLAKSFSVAPSSVTKG